MATTKTNVKQEKPRAEKKPVLQSLAGNDYLVIVGYQTKPMSELGKYVPQFVANKTLKDPAKIEADLAAKKSQFEATAGCLPYFGRLRRVVLVDCQPMATEGSIVEFSDSGSESVGVQVAEWLEQRFSDCWSNRLDGRWGEMMMQFVGFNPKTFLKIMGVECALAGKPCPGNMWYGNSDHRDISTFLLPDELPKITTDWTIPARMLNIDMSNPPGTSPEADIAICVQVLQKFGFLR